jgi:pimeloyl-ACP methyl ester carboxylesterase
MGKTEAMTGTPAGDAVEQFLRANVIPSRRSQPRLAESLVGVERHLVPSAAGRVAAWRVGDGPAVVLVHGWEDDNSLWAPLIDTLIERGRALVVFDLPGHGFSEGDWGLGFQAADGMHAVAEALAPVDAVVAHSAGAGGATLAMAEGLTVAKGALVAMPLSRSNRWLRVADRLGVSHDIALAAQARFEQRIGRDRAAFDVRAELAALDIDLLLVHSADDERYPLSDAREIAPKCRRAELFEVEGLSHRRTARDPAVVARLADFVTETHR